MLSRWGRLLCLCTLVACKATRIFSSGTLGISHFLLFHPGFPQGFLVCSNHLLIVKLLHLAIYGLSLAASFDLKCISNSLKFDFFCLAEQ
jgi:hypothetical protein